MRDFPWGVVLMLSGLFLAFALVGLWVWVLFLAGVTVWLALVELWIVRRTGLTMSGHFTLWARRHPWAAAALAAVLGAAVGYLIYHLATGY